MTHPRSVVLSPGVAALVLFVGCADDPPTSGFRQTNAPAPVPVASPVLQQACAEVVNSYRTTLPRTPLVPWTDSASCFARQAKDDALGGVGHAHFGVCGESAQNTCPGWGSGATDSAQIATLRQCAKMMWDEGPGDDFSRHGHYLNMANAAYTSVGCGYFLQEGRLWINMDFR